MSRRSSPLDAEPCRQCTSFSDYVKITRKQILNENSEASHAISAKVPRTDCPLDRDELGNKSWGLLHTIASKYPEKPSSSTQKDIKVFFEVFSRLYPCDHCAEDFRKELKRDPPLTESYEALSQWLCRLHNKVNAKIGKEEFDCSKIDERWRDGWSDRSCD